MFHKSIVLLFIVTLIVTFAAYTAHAQDKPLAIPTEGLVAYWTMDEIKKSPNNTDIVEDIVGDNDGALQSAKLKVVKGKYGNALEWGDVRGDAKPFILLDSKKLPFTGNSAFSVSAWIFKDKKGDQVVYCIVYIGVFDQGNNGYFLWTFNGRRTNNQIRTGFFPSELFGKEIVMNQWNHVAGVYDPVAKKNFLYLNGVEVGVKDINFEPDIQPGPLPGKRGQGATIGADTRHQQFWDGLIDEVGVYNRVLTPAEVQRIANAPQIFAVEPGGKLSLVWGAIKAAR